MPLRRPLDNRYELRESLGSGAMAEVYLARDRVLDREVAVKVLNRCYAGDEDFVRRFRREARNAASLGHPNVVSVHDMGEAPQPPGEPPAYYIAMEYVDGPSLRGILEREGRLSVAGAVGIARQAALGLGAAHDRGLVHRDVKPSNILIPELLDPDGGQGSRGFGGRVKVADFGIARLSEAAGSSGDLLGSAHYVSPEQAMGGEATPQSDLYSLGIVLYEMLTGHRPYDSTGHPFEAAMRHVTGTLVPPNRVVPDLPEKLNSTVVRLLGKDPEERHQDAEELISDLEEISRSVEAPVAEPESRRRGAVRNAVLVPLCALMVLTATLWTAQQGFGLPALRGLGELMFPVEVRNGVDRVLGRDESGAHESGAGGSSADEPEEARRDNSEPAAETSARPGTPDTTKPGDPAPERSGPGGSQPPLAPEEAGSGRSGGDGGDEEASVADGAPRTESADGETSREPEETVRGGASDSGQEAAGGQTGNGRDPAGGSRGGEEGQGLYVPDLTGQPVEYARAALESTGFVVSGVTQEPGEPPAGSVLRTDPPAGAFLEPGAGVAVVVSSGPLEDVPSGGEVEPPPETSPGGSPGEETVGDQEPVTVPDVSGLQSGQAVSILESAGLQAEVRGAFGGEGSGEVVASDPRAGSTVEEGTLVTLTVIDEPATAASEEPPDGGDAGGGTGEPGSPADPEEPGGDQYDAG